VLTVTVTNRNGQLVRGLNRDAFQLIDEKTVRPLVVFENTSTPMSLGILIDISPSVLSVGDSRKANSKAIVEAISRFIQSDTTGNEYFLATFDRTAHFSSDWITAAQFSSKKFELPEVKRDTATALYDTCFKAIDKLRRAQNPRRVLIVLSDGDDNASVHTFGDLRNRLGASDLTLYAVVPPNEMLSILGQDKGKGAGILKELTQATGGVTYLLDFPADQRNLRGAFDQIAVELKNQYRIGFQADPPGHKKEWHRLKLNIDPGADKQEFRNLNIRMREGYYATP